VAITLDRGVVNAQFHDMTKKGLKIKHIEKQTTSFKKKERKQLQKKKQNQNFAPNPHVLAFQPWVPPGGAWGLEVAHTFSVEVSPFLHSFSLLTIDSHHTDNQINKSKKKTKYLKRTKKGRRKKTQVPWGGVQGAGVEGGDVGGEVGTVGGLVEQSAFCVDAK
jgi:hypothetical protein